LSAFRDPPTFIDMLTEIRRHHTLVQIAKRRIVREELEKGE
jgi:hypothetical protein